MPMAGGGNSSAAETFSTGSTRLLFGLVLGSIAYDGSILRLRVNELRRSLRLFLRIGSPELHAAIAG